MALSNTRFINAFSAALLLAACAGTLKAQENSTRIRFSTLAEDTPGGGLSSNHVQGIVQDLSGYVWIATDKGLNRFDGWVVTKYHESDLPETGLSSDLLTCDDDQPIGEHESLALYLDRDFLRGIDPIRQSLRQIHVDPEIST